MACTSRSRASATRKKGRAREEGNCGDTPSSKLAPDGAKPCARPTWRLLQPLPARTKAIDLRSAPRRLAFSPVRGIRLPAAQVLAPRCVCTCRGREEPGQAAAAPNAQRRRSGRPRRPPDPACRGRLGRAAGQAAGGDYGEEYRARPSWGRFDPCRYGEAELADVLGSSLPAWRGSMDSGAHILARRRRTASRRFPLRRVGGPPTSGGRRPAVRATRAPGPCHAQGRA
jgi:hypothetical protein